MSLIRHSQAARRILCAVLPILFIVVSGVRVRAQAAPIMVSLVTGRSTVIDVGAPIARVSLTSAEIADALVTSSSQLLVNGKLPGTISMFVWERSGALRLYEVKVQRDIDHLGDQMKQLFPGEAIEVHANGSNIVLSGRVSDKTVAEKAVSVAAGFVDNKDSVVSLLTLQEAPRTDQVLLRVRFAEVSRSALTELGVSFFTSPTGIRNTVGRLTTQQFDAPTFSELEWNKDSGDFGSPVTSASGKLTFGDFLNLFLLSEKFDLGMMIRALSNRGLFQSLAEPNLVAESGKEASFLAGGEFPIPVAQGGAGNLAISIVFKEFGVRLNFTPTVNGDRVHLKVRPEVSTLDFANGVHLQGFRIPALSTRRTETELELRDGQTFAIAGLLDSSMSSTLQKIPGIGDIPILGRLFQSKAARKDRTELVVMITPEILRPNSPGVTNALPRISEPFMEPLPRDKSLEMPPPPFPPVPQAGSPVVQSEPPAVARPVAHSGPDRPTAVEAGLQAHAAVVEAGLQARPADRKAQERARREAEERARRQARADAEAQKAAAKAAEKAAAQQAEADRRRAAEEQKAAKRAAEEARRREEAERRHQKAIAEAEMRLKAAQTAFQQERAGSARP